MDCRRGILTVREMILDLFESIRTKQIAMFDEPYDTVANIVVSSTREPRGGGMCYSEFHTMKLPNIDGIKNPVVSMRWIVDVGCSTSVLVFIA